MKQKINVSTLDQIIEFFGEYFNECLRSTYGPGVVVGIHCPQSSYLCSNLCCWSKKGLPVQGGKEVDHLTVVQTVALLAVVQVILNKNKRGGQFIKGLKMNTV